MSNVPASAIGLSSDTSLGLDILRVLAAQSVLIGHALSFVYRDDPDHHTDFIQQIGVYVFFLLSGFVIAYSVDCKRSDPTYGFGSFFLDRLVRIYVAWIPALALVAVLDFLYLHFLPTHYLHAKSFSAGTWLANVAMLQDYPIIKLLRQDISASWFTWQISFPTSFGSGRPFWTKAIEWWIYLSFGWMVFWGKRRIGTLFCVLVMIVFAIVPLFNALGGRGNGLTLVWFLGVAAYLLREHRCFAALSARNAAMICALTLICAYLRLAASNYAPYDPILAVIMAISFLFFTLSMRRTNLVTSVPVTRSIRTAAGYAFSLYLLHYTILEFLALEVPTGAPMLLMIGGCIAANVIAYLFASRTEMHYKRVRAWIRAWLSDRRRPASD